MLGPNDVTRPTRALRDEILRRAERERHGMSRRQFMESTMGMAITLAAINELGCRGAQGTSGGDGGNCGFAPKSGPYVVAPEATCDPSAHIACTDFIFDIQTYCFDAGEWRTRNIQYPTELSLLGRCDAANPLDCFDPKHYAEGIFLGSDTTMTVITGFPASDCFPERQLLHNAALACGLPLSNASIRSLRDWINERAMSQRCINHCVVMRASIRAPMRSVPHRPRVFLTRATLRPTRRRTPPFSPACLP